MSASGNSESPLAGACAAYLEDLADRRYSAKTAAVYGRALADFRGFAAGRRKRAARDVGKEDLPAYRLSLIDRGFRPTSVHVYMRAVRNLFGWLSRRRDLFLNPAEGLVLRSPPRPLLPAPSEEQVRMLLEAADTGGAAGVRDRAMLETLYGGGLRRAELCALSTADVDVGEATVRVMGKGERERVVPVGRAAARWLDRYLREARPALLAGRRAQALWIGRCGPLSYHMLPFTLAECSRKAGLGRISPHALRRACATHMLAGGASPLEVQLQLGHATLKHLSQYLRVSIADIRRMHDGSRPGQ